MKKLLKLITVLGAVFTGFIGVTFTLYWFNLDMKLVRKIYDALQPHYDNLQKDRKL